MANENKGKWKKAPRELIGFLDESMKGKEADRKTMFGFPVYFVNGNMFAGLFEDSFFLRLSRSEIDSIEKKGISLACLEPMKGRPMKNYHVIPDRLLSDKEEFPAILEEALIYARQLPPKAKKK